MRPSQRNTPYTWSGDWSVLRSLLPYLMEFRGRVIIASVTLILAKLAGVAVPIVMKYIVDALDTAQARVIAVPMALLLAYGLLRFGGILLGEIRDAVFGRVTERAMRRIGLKVFRHLHSLDLEFHLSRQTGAVARDIDRGSNGISFLLRFLLFNILPTLFEIALVAGILLFGYGLSFALIIVLSVLLYIVFSVVLTEWRTEFIRNLNEMDNQTNTRTVDSLLNFETVKYFANEEYEAAEYDRNLAAWETARRKNRLSLIALNTVQALIVASAMTWMMILSARQVAAGSMSLGDLVLVNAYMMQLFIPLNFLGFVYREIKRALADVEHLFALLDQRAGVSDRPGAVDLEIREGSIDFDGIRFAYHPDRQILDRVSFTIPAGKKVAVVGPSGAGKSTLARLLFRFYDPDGGAVRIDGRDIRELTRLSLRRAIGVVPQDTVLFNNTIEYNIAYGRPEATAAEVREAARLADLESFINSLPEGYETRVGERGLRLSGGEKQRIAIARMLLKNPPIMVFDEATSSLDSATEQAILTSLREIASHRTTLVIAHRLSTII
ncbi:MAG TPA: ABC transporter ATP-binding protein/permease, partial [Gammaproteobacteria bacterium]|nr:ABC transporter ATP-binding protein/permease [Gammaproteobacteria bacterium]